MQSWYGGRLSAAQQDRLRQWLPGARLRADMSWQQLDTTVLDVDTEMGRVVVKAAGPDNHHIGREITAYQGFTECLSRTGHAPTLLFDDLEANLVVLRHVPGWLVQGSDAEFAEDTYRQAGRLARTLHDQAARTDPDWDAASVTKSVGWLDKPHRIAPGDEAALRRVLSAHRPRPVAVVPTHGDWQPRNWLIDTGTVRVIDFGRFAWRPAVSDFCRLAAQQWRHDPALATAFFDGYGGDPRDPAQWRMFALHEAVGTAVWAHQVGDETFEQQGHRMVAEALTLF